MHVDETKDRVFIPDLDKELEDVESGDERLVFLPDIERKFSMIPDPVLRSASDPGNQLILYNVPSSLSVPMDEETVRKAISEARARAREVQHIITPTKVEEVEEEDGTNIRSSEATPIVEEIDDNAMVID